MSLPLDYAPEGSYLASQARLKRPTSNRGLSALNEAQSSIMATSFSGESGMRVKAEAIAMKCFLLMKVLSFRFRILQGKD